MYSKSVLVFAICCVALTVATGGSQSVSHEQAKLLRSGTDLKNQWSFGNCGTYVRSQDLVYYDHVKIQANSASTTVTDTVGWNGAKAIYCIELIGNQGTQWQVASGGINYRTVSVSGVSAVGKDLEGLVYVYAS